MNAPMSASPDPRRNSGTTIGLVVVLVLAVAGLVFLQFRSRTVTPELTPVVDPATEQLMPFVPEEGAVVIPDEGEEVSAVKEFTIEAGSYYFEPSILRVNVGDTVRITINSVGAGMMHNFALDEYDIELLPIPGGESTSFEFVATTAGTFEYYCSVMDHRQMGQVGTLIVE